MYIYYLILLNFLSVSFANPKIAHGPSCFSSTAFMVKCQNSCPLQIKVKVDETIVFDSCEKDAWKGVFKAMTYFSFQDSKKNNRFIVNMDVQSSIKVIQIYGGSTCKDLKKMTTTRNIVLEKNQCKSYWVKDSIRI